MDSLIHLKKNDRVLGRIIDKIGPFELKLKRHKNLYRPLMESVVYQQLAGKAAAAILGRFVALYPDKDFPTVEDVLSTSISKLRSSGLSQAKAIAITDIAQKTLDGIVPEPKAIKKLSDDEIIERLTTIRGVGPWTVHMLLIKMGRPDVLPVSDYGVRKAFALAYKKKDLPTPKELTEHAEAWRPYRSVASWYLWRFLD
jgi:DNA-3-methyladenine glycosylase II